MTHENVKAWVYVLYLSAPARSTYIGFTTWLVRRIRWHQIGYFPHAYTADKRPVIVLAAIPMPNRKAAMRLERRLKGLRREQKFAFVVGDRALFDFLAFERRARRRKVKAGRAPVGVRSCRVLEREALAGWRAGGQSVGIPELVFRWTGVWPVGEGPEGIE